MTDRYDHHFRLYAGIYFDGIVDWPWFKAQAFAESGLNPRAVSPAGAQGIMQLMPATSAEIAGEMWLDNRPFDARMNILFGIHYMYKMWSIWKQEDGLERLRFALASYNAGPGSILRAQRMAIRKDSWASLAIVLPQVTGRRATETIEYVERVERIRKEILQD